MEGTRIISIKITIRIIRTRRRIRIMKRGARV